MGGITERIYLDHAASTPLDEDVLRKMLPYFTQNFGNANSQHYFGRRAMAALDDARGTIASLIGAKENEVFFTSGGTEGDNIAMFGAARAMAKKGSLFPPWNIMPFPFPRNGSPKRKASIFA